MSCETPEPEQACNEAVERLSVMLSQESTIYVTRDYISMQYMDNSCLQHLSSREDEQSDDDNDRVLVSPEWRQQIAEWYLLLAKTFKLKREVVSFAMSYLDRFLGKYFCDRVMLELAASTSIYLAVKAHDSERQEQLKILPRLSQTGISGRHIVQMEIFMLRSLNWLISPPIAESYVSDIISILFHHFRMSQEELEQVTAFATLCCDLALTDYFFAIHKPSTVALSSIVNSLQYHYPPHEGEEESSSAAYQFSEVLQEELASINVFASETTSCCLRMWELLKRHGQAIRFPDSPAIVCGYDDSQPMIALTQSPVCIGDILPLE